MNHPGIARRKRFDCLSRTGSTSEHHVSLCSALLCSAPLCSLNACTYEPQSNTIPLASESEKPNQIAEGKAEKSQPFTSAGIERVIPLRIVNLNNTSGSSQVALIPYDQIREEISLANSIFQPAGVQFYIHSWESYYSPVLNEITETDRTWAAVSSEITAIFPSAFWPPSSASGWPSTLSERDWLHYASKFANSSQITVYIVSKRTNGSNGALPHAAPANVILSKFHIGATGNEGVFAHELGHSIGLEHIHEIKTRQPSPQIYPADPKRLWDLVYQPGDGGSNPHKIFDNYDEASDAGVIENIDQTNNCTPNYDGTGAFKCIVPEVPGSVDAGYYETWYHADAGMKGVAFDRFYPSGPQRGANIMGYYFNNAIGISRSQADMVRDFLRSDVPVKVPNTLAYLATTPGGGDQHKTNSIGSRSLMVPTRST